MDPQRQAPNHRKRKRRRGAARPAIPAQLVIDDRLEGGVGFLSEDLFDDLFPELVPWKDRGSKSDSPVSPTGYVAITVQAGSSIPPPDRAQWTVLPVKKSVTSSSGKQLPGSTIAVPASYPALPSFLHKLPRPSQEKRAASLNYPIDIFILDVAPLPLNTVVVSVDDGISSDADQVHYSAASLHPAAAYMGSGNEPDGSLSNVQAHDNNKWEEAVRSALKGTSIIHTEDALKLSPGPRPRTDSLHASAVVAFCEPVSQGLLFPWTKIVIVSNNKQSRKIRKPPDGYINGMIEEEEDTANEQFFSAAEDRYESPVPKARSGGEARYTESESPGAEYSDQRDMEFSDTDSEAVGLDLPVFSVQTSEGLSTTRGNSVHHTGLNSPGSIVSGYSTSTIRGDGTRARVFQTRGLSARIPDERLSPKPAANEDDEARVYTDTASLAKIGYFSGDWLKIEAVANASHTGFGSWDIERSSSAGDRALEWRVVKVYALPDTTANRPRYLIRGNGHRDSTLSFPYIERETPKVYMSPILLANIGSPSAVQLMPHVPNQLHGLSRSPHHKAGTRGKSLPPFAKEVALYKIVTPLSTERNMQTSLFQGGRTYFESKSRIVKHGDLIGIPIDDELGRAMYQGSIEEEGAEQEELLTRIGYDLETRNGSNNAQVGWFKVGQVVADINKDDHEVDESEIWGGLVVVRPGITRMAQTGSELCKLPATLGNQWPYYLGMKRLTAKPFGKEFKIEDFAELPRSHISHTRRRLRELISAATSPQAAHFKLPPVAILLVSTQRHIGKATAVQNACADLGIHTFSIDSYDILSEGGSGGGDVKTAGLLEARAERALTCGADFTALLIKHIDILVADRMTSTLRHILANSRVLFATTSDIEKIPEGVRSLFTHELEISAPDEGEREGLLRDIVRDAGLLLSSDVDMSSVALKTAALVAGDLVDVVDRAAVARDERLEKLAETSSAHLSDHPVEIMIRDIRLAGGDASRCLVKADFDVAVDAARKNFADAIGAPKIPNVSWDDVGGLTNVKDSVMETIQLPLERPELFAKGMKKRSGILFYGPPGTGKTLLAKAIATEFSLNFFSVKGPELLNMYIGESEANVRRVFQRARDARPCVVFFDELDSVAPKRGKSGDSGGVMDRIVSQLLAELDGMSGGDDGSGGGGVFVIAATNRPDLLDEALLRPGRFDKMLYLGVSDTHEKQLTILEALTRKFALHPKLSLLDVASTLPFTYSGADLYALCSDAMLKAITRRASSVDTKVRAVNATRAATSPPLAPISVAYFFDHLAGPEDTEVVVEKEDFELAVRELVPSISAKELKNYERIRRSVEQANERQGAVNGTIDVSHGKLLQDPADDDFILRTEKLTMSDSPSVAVNGVDDSGRNGNVLGRGLGKAKGKGKGKQVANDNNAPMGFGDAAESDDALYS